MAFELKPRQPDAQGGLCCGSIRGAGGAYDRRCSIGCRQSFQTPIQVRQRVVLMWRLRRYKGTSKQEGSKNR